MNIFIKKYDKNMYTYFYETHCNKFIAQSKEKINHPRGSL